MFKNPVMELLSISGPKMMVTYHLIVISAVLGIGFYKLLPDGYSVWQILGVFFGAIFVWSIAEYFMHRYLFHYVNDNKYVKGFHYAMHGYHHEQPNDTNRLFMPPVPASLFLLAFFGIFYLIMGKFAWAFLPGFEFGYLMYSFTHYSIHTRKAPKGREKLWHNHLIHHYKEPEKAFGVSSIMWDKVFHTLPETSAEEAKKNETVVASK